jgi:hypothetical protein
MAVDDNKALALRFFEALDTGNVGLLEDMFTEDCVFHRGDLIEPARVCQVYVRLSISGFNSIETFERQFIR